MLDALWARWRESRLLKSRVDWQTQALEHWEPGALLSTMLAFPEERVDRYVLDGVEYQVDMLFCVQPDCDCTEARLSVLELSANRKEAVETGSAWLPLETMKPRGFEDLGLSSKAFARLFLEWRRRNVPAKERLAELRAMTRRRGVQLHEFVEHSASTSRASRSSLPATSSKKIGRNTPCPCGSGKKYKRCCGK